ncbi:MAG: hypothetical protein ABJ360_17730 [Roseobacter sp.]|uniref:hypothetical protein n=1 Tax=Tateyamaria sp. TaxID=1929288 RepID=UPI00327600F0
MGKDDEFWENEWKTFEVQRYGLLTTLPPEASPEHHKVVESHFDAKEKERQRRKDSGTRKTEWTVAEKKRIVAKVIADNISGIRLNKSGLIRVHGAKMRAALNARESELGIKQRAYHPRTLSGLL